MLNNIKPSVKELLIVYGIGLITTLLSVIFFVIRGYPLVNTATETLSIVAPPLYMNSIFLPYGMLISELLWKWYENKEHRISILFFAESIVVGILSLIRYIINIPLSGHAIIIFFYIFHQLIINKAKFPIRLLIGLVVFIITVIYKIFFWNDTITFLLGGVVGIALWVPGFLYQRQKLKKKVE